MTAVGEFAAGGAGQVRALACAVVDDRPVALAGCDRGEVQVWDLLDRTQRGVLTTGAGDLVRAVAVAQVGGRTIVVAGADGDTLHRWDFDADLMLPRTSPIGAVAAPARIDGEFLNRITAVDCVRVNGRSLAAVGGDEGQAWIWPLDRAAPRPIDIGLAGRVMAVAFGRVAGRPVAAFVAGDGTLRVWDVDGARLTFEPFAVALTAVRAVACTAVQDRPIVLTAGLGTVHLWDPVSGAPAGRPLAGHTAPVHAIACGIVRHEHVVVTGGDDRTIRVWNLSTGECRWVIPMPAVVFALAVTDDGAIVACVDRDVVVLELRPGFEPGLARGQARRAPSRLAKDAHT
jgi:WD40 repeat protein